MKNLTASSYSVYRFSLPGFPVLAGHGIGQAGTLLNVTVEIEHFYPVAGSSANQAGTVGVFRDFSLGGEKIGQPGGYGESTSVARPFFSSMSGMILTLSASSVSESAAGASGWFAQYLEPDQSVFVLVDRAGGRFAGV